MFFNSKKKKETDSEKRKEERAEFFQTSYYLPVRQDEESATFECWFNNISKGGLSFETKREDLKEGDEIKVLYKIGTKFRNDKLRIQFASRFLDRFKCGCAFIDADEERKYMIDEYLSIRPIKIEKQ